MQRSPKAMLLRPTNVDLPECDCHLAAMESAGRRSRPVLVCVLSLRSRSMPLSLLVPEYSHTARSPATNSVPSSLASSAMH